MGWKGTLRSISAAAKAAERGAQRRHKQAEKERIADEAASAVEDWQDYLAELVSIHSATREAVDWATIASTPKPIEPALGTDHQTAARAALENHPPRFFDFIKGGTAKIKAKLTRDAETAAQRDQADFEKRYHAYQASLQEWEEDSGLAKRLIEGDVEATREVLEEMQSLTDEGLIGSRIKFAITDDHVHAKPEVHSDDIVPKFRRKQLASGRLSETKMPVGEFNELYQDYVASVALRIAGDLFSILPAEAVYVTCLAEMLDTSTGHKKPTPILSVQFVRDTFVTLNLSHIDPSDSLRNFRHEMKFSRTKGFSAITPLVDN